MAPLAVVRSLWTAAAGVAAKDYLTTKVDNLRYKTALSGGIIKDPK
jgi:hypothetical protein